jgi:hypothetical protein
MRSIQLPTHQSLTQVTRPLAPTNATELEQIDQRLTDWVNAGPENECAVRMEVKDEILAAEPRINNNNQIHIGGDLDLENHTSLTQLPDNLSVGGYLDLQNCTALTQLPNNLRVGGDLYLINCPTLAHMGNNLSVEGDLEIRVCAAITRLPDHLSIGGKLSIIACRRLTYLTNNLRVDGNAEFMNCPALTELSDSLSVHGELYIEACNALARLPNNLNINDNLTLRRCRRLSTLPNEIHTLGLRADGLNRQITLIRTGLSEAALDQLRQSEHPGIEFIFNDPPDPRTLRQQAAAQIVWEQLPPANPNHVDAEAVCPISHVALSELRKPVYVIPARIDGIEQLNNGHVFELSALLDWYVQQPTNPMNREPLSLDQLQRIER